MYFQAVPPDSSSETFRNILSALTFVLSIINLVYAITIFRYKNKKDDTAKEKDVRAAAFNSLIISPNLSVFYDFFDKIEQELRKLSADGVTLEQKSQINDFIIDQLTNVRLRFVDLFRTVSFNLYKRSFNTLDQMVDQFTREILDENLDFTDVQVFQDKVIARLSSCKTAVLTQMLAFDGSEDATSVESLSVVPHD